MTCLDHLTLDYLLMLQGETRRATTLELLAEALTAKRKAKHTTEERARRVDRFWFTIWEMKDRVITDRQARIDMDDMIYAHHAEQRSLYH